MTPEEARTLLEDATPGPWRVGEKAGCGCCMRVTAPAALVCTPSTDEAPLVAAAPELAELVAGLRYEYAVHEDVGYWRQRGEWFDTVEEATDYRDMKREEAPMCIVRRLVGDPEVVQP